MGIFDFITKRGVERKTFSSHESLSVPLDKPAAVKTLTSNLISYELELSDFANMDEEDIYEQLYLYESEIGGAIDRTSTMVGESYKGFYLKEAGATVDGIEKEMIENAKKIDEAVNIRGYMEMFAELISIKGNLYLKEDPNDLTLTILPNKYVTLVDRKDRLMNASKGEFDMIMDGKYLVLFEGQSGYQQVYEPDQFIHVKYKNTPVFEKDSRGRMTFGVYSISPLNRVILPVWWKRQTMILDMLVRQMNVPREHHMIDSRMFNLNLYSGTPEQKLEKATASIKSFIESYTSDIKNKTPDMGYVTLDTTKIETINNGSGTNYLQTNELISQINDQVWSALNMPKSMISGESSSSYSSELIIANYVCQKVLQLANKVKPIILDNIKSRLIKINPNYPIEQLDIKIELDIVSTEIEKMRKMAIMGDLGIFTETELRDMVGMDSLRPEQRKELVKTGAGSKGTSVPLTSNAAVSLPETPTSMEQHSNDSSTRAIRADK